MIDALMGVVEVAAGLLFALLALLIAVEFVRPARRWPAVPGWRRKCLAFMPMVIAISIAIPLLMAPLTGGLRLLPGHRLGIIGGTVVGIVLSELLIYWAHRLRARSA